MKITLISPYPDLKVFGLRILSACLKKEGHNVQLIFLPKMFNEKYKEENLRELVKLSEGSALIGVSLMTNFFSNAVQITSTLKNNLNIPIIWGGIHPTVRPEECLNYADMVCLGEGEASLVELARKIEDKEKYDDVLGIWVKGKGGIIKNALMPLIHNLDTIPFQDIDYNTHYILNKHGFDRMDTDKLNGDWCGVYTTMAARGCPFGCTYCCNNSLNKMYPGRTGIRRRSIDSFIGELVVAKEKFPFLNCMKIEDDDFLLYPLNEMEEFCVRYKREIGLQLKIIGVNPSTLTREKFSLLVDAGLSIVKMGIQTGSERTKKLYGRHHSNIQVEKAARLINEFKDKLRMLPHYDIILDNPWETDEDLISTLMFLARIPVPHQIQYFSLTFYPGTELYERAKRERLIRDEMRDIYEKDYFNFKKTYLKRLFFLLNDFAFYGFRIPTGLMFLLTHRRIRKLKINWLLYIALKFCSYILKLQRIDDLLYVGLKDIKSGNWQMLRKRLFRWF